MEEKRSEGRRGRGVKKGEGEEMRRRGEEGRWRR